MTDTANDPYSMEALRAEYERACAERDATLKRVAPLQEFATTTANEAEAARVRSMQAKQALIDARGGPAWFELKHRIGRLAKLLGGK